MVEEENGLARGPARGVEGDVRKALFALVDDIHNMRLGLPCNGYADQQLERVQGRLFEILAALSAAPGVGVAAASSIPTASEDRRVEEMRERCVVLIHSVRAENAAEVEALRAENARLRRDRGAVWEWIRQPDWTDADWSILDWLNSRPSHLTRPLLATPERPAALPPASSPEDQEKAAATPTIADPDGEARDA